MDCNNCLGRGLVSTGADPRDLDVGGKTTCQVCSGSGKVPEVVQVVAAQENDPKVESPSSEKNGGGALDGQLEAIEPKVGDPCILLDGSEGQLASVDGNGWTCIPRD